jgi:hypothetical protein
MTQTQGIRPSLWWAALAIPSCLAGAALAIFFMVTEMQQADSSVIYASVPGGKEVDLKTDLSYTVLLEQMSGGSSDPTPIVALKSRVRCELHALPNGDDIPMSALSGSATYSFGDRSGISFLKFTVPRDGTYLLACQDHRGRPGPPLRVAIASGVVADTTAALEKALVSFFGGGIVALLIFVRVLMLRDQSKREIRALGMKPV